MTKTNKGKAIQINLSNENLSFNIYNYSSVVCGYSIGKNINYHPGSDTDLKLTRGVLQAMNIQQSNWPLKIKTEHKDKVLIDSDDGLADAIISTKGTPIILSPADCIGLILIDKKSNYYGLCHIGRSGVGCNIVKNFLVKLIELTPVDRDLTFIISPNIKSESYAHKNNNFLYTDGQPNWWHTHREFIKESGGFLYPDLENAVIRQIHETLPQNVEIEIIQSGLDTYTGNIHSNSRDKKEGIIEKRRNLVFVGTI